MMGSGGMVVMDETTCMVDVAKFFLAFTQAESCGKCPPCRLGTHHMLEILERITSGKGSMEDLERLEEIAKRVAKTSLCGLGQGAPIPVLSTLRYFRDEYEEHVKEKYCRAKVCRGQGTYVINQEECILCGLCVKACAYDAVKETRDTYFIEQDYCTKCKACYTVCPTDAVKILKKLEAEDDLALTEEVEAG
jgi:NADH:ubiquinone oxidoreductase subunit F (NADH-binding)